MLPPSEVWSFCLRLQVGQLPYERQGSSSSFRPGKRKGRPLIAAAGGSEGTISITDRLLGRSFLEDSGADECVFPATSSDLLLPHTATLVAANGSDIKTFGKRDITLSFAPGVQMVHKFWIATVRRPILGADFFA